MVQSAIFYAECTHKFFARRVNAFIVAWDRKKIFQVVLLSDSIPQPSSSQSSTKPPVRWYIWRILGFFCDQPNFIPIAQGDETSFYILDCEVVFTLSSSSRKYDLMLGAMWIHPHYDHIRRMVCATSLPGVI